MIVVHNRNARREQRKLAPRVRSDEIVKVENAEDHLRRVTKWLKVTAQWCIQALSLHCLRRSTRTVYAVKGPPAYSCAPAQRPTYESLYQGSLRCAPTYVPSDTDDDDDSEMRIARQAAAEIEWHIEEAKPLTAGGIQMKSGLWSNDEHERYCQGLEKYRYGSWKIIADYVGTRTERQVLSHAQSIRAKRKRAEERGQTESTTSKPGASGQTGANKSARTTTAAPSYLTLENKVTPGGSSLPAIMNSSPTRSLAYTSTAGSDATNVEVGMPTSTFKPEGFEFGIGVASAADATTREAGIEHDELISTHMAKDCIAQFTLEDLDISSDVLLCSPSLDILLGNAVSDEIFCELLDIPSTLSEVHSSRASLAEQ